METRVITITPDMAIDYLAKNKAKNRNIKPKNLDFFERHLREGTFETTHQGIAFDHDGNILDGQHRLIAIVNTKIPAKMQVSFNVSKELFNCIDCGATRTISDNAAVAFKNGQKLSEAASFLLRMSGYGFKLSHHNVFKFSEIIQDAHAKVLEASNSARRTFSSSPVRSAAVYTLMTGGSEAIVLSNYRNLATLNLQDSPPVLRAFVSQIDCGRVKFTNQNELFCRALIVFNKDKQNNTKIQLSSTSEPIAMTKKWVIKMME